jgi:hypothetical protein
MVRQGMLPKELIIDSWGNSLYSSWPIVRPLIDEYRKKRGPNFWDDYERLSKEAKKYAVKHDTYKEHPNDAEQWQVVPKVAIPVQENTSKQD